MAHEWSAKLMCCPWTNKEAFNHAKRDAIRSTTDATNAADAEGFQAAAGGRRRRRRQAVKSSAATAKTSSEPPAVAPEASQAGVVQAAGPTASTDDKLHIVVAGMLEFLKESAQVPPALAELAESAAALLPPPPS